MQANKMFPTYVFCKVQRDRVPQVVEELRKYSEIEFNAQVTGRYDIVMRIKTSNPEQLYNTINKIRSIHGVNATNTFTANDGFVNGQKLDSAGRLGIQPIINQQANTGSYTEAEEPTSHIRHVEYSRSVRHCHELQGSEL